MITTAALSLLLVGFALAGQLDEDPDCRPQSHHKKRAEMECCKIPKMFSKDKSKLRELVHECFEEAGIEHPRHHGEHPRPPPPPDHKHPPPPPPMNDTTLECVDQCVFKDFELITESIELDEKRLEALVTENFTDDWEKVAFAAVEKCVAYAKKKVDESSKCKSGARQFSTCFSREVFLNCPTSQWTKSDECTATKERVMKCPNMFWPIHKM